MSTSSRSVFQILRSSGFLSSDCLANQFDQLSTFGLLFRTNLIRLLEQLDRQSVIPVFPVNRLEHVDEALCSRLFQNQSLITDQTNQFNKQSQTFALRTDQILTNTNLITSIGDFRWSCNHTQSLAIHCPQANALNTFHSMQSNRYRFWRSLSQFPANFHLKEVRSESDVLQQSSIEFRKGDLIVSLEQISFKQNQLDQSNEEENEIKNKHKSQSVVQCDTFIDNCAIALLIDALVDKSNRSVMMLNERLVPYQVAVAVIGETDERSSEVIDYLYSLTKHLHISVYPFLYQIQSLEAQFDNLDKIGILYTIIVDSTTLSKGIVHLRNRDTELMEQQHISKIQEYLPLYTKTRRPHEIVESKQKHEKNAK